MPYSLI